VPPEKVNFIARGFTPYEASGLELLVGQNMDLINQSADGQAARTVEVAGAAPIVEDAVT